MNGPPQAKVQVTSLAGREDDEHGRPTWPLLRAERQPRDDPPAPPWCAKEPAGPVSPRPSYRPQRDAPPGASERPCRLRGSFQNPGKAVVDPAVSG